METESIWNSLSHKCRTWRHSFCACKCLHAIQPGNRRGMWNIRPHLRRLQLPQRPHSEQKPHGCPDAMKSCPEFLPVNRIPNGNQKKPPPHPCAIDTCLYDPKKGAEHVDKFPKWNPLGLHVSRQALNRAMWIKTYIFRQFRKLRLLLNCLALGRSNGGHFIKAPCLPEPQKVCKYIISTNVKCKLIFCRALGYVKLCFSKLF